MIFKKQFNDDSNERYWIVIAYCLVYFYLLFNFEKIYCQGPVGNV